MSQKTSFPIIDVHCHVVSPDRVTYPLAPIGGQQSDWSSQRPTTPQQLIEAMDAAGVAKAAVVQASTAYGHNSSYLADSLKYFPDRFTGVFSIDPLEADAQDQIDRWVGRGMTGMRVFTTGSTMPGQQTWLDDERAYPTWEKAGKLKLPVAVQMTAQGIPLLVKILKQFPNTNFALDHLARPSLGDGAPYAAAASLFELAAFPNVYLKFTSRTAENVQSGKATPETFLPKLISAFGSNRILWGSNYPAHDDSLSNIVDIALGVLKSLPVADQANIFSGTATHLYPSLK